MLARPSDPGIPHTAVPKHAHPAVDGGGGQGCSGIEGRGVGCLDLITGLATSSEPNTKRCSNTQNRLLDFMNKCSGTRYLVLGT
jgi:hypothetical protein